MKKEYKPLNLVMNGRYANYYNAGTHRVLCQDSAAQDDCLGEQSSGLTGSKAEKADD